MSSEFAPPNQITAGQVDFILYGREDVLPGEVYRYNGGVCDEQVLWLTRQELESRQVAIQVIP